MSQFTCVCAYIYLCSIIHLAVSGFCDFENNLCNWTSTQTKQPHWFRRTGIPGKQPVTDHTWNNSSGYYLYLRGNQTTPGIVAELKSETLNQPNACLTFWYYMYGSESLSLWVLLVNGSSFSRELWTVSGNQGDVWNVKVIDINHTGDFHLVFKGEKADQGWVALDDISITGSCLDCNFEHESYNWHYEKTNNPAWKIVTKSNEYSYKQDSFLAADAVNSSNCIDKYRFCSKLLTRPCRATLNFNYFLRGKEDTYIKVFVRDDSSNEYNVSEKIGSSSNSVWKDDKAIISKDAKYIIIFEASLGKNCSGRVGVDDITLTYGSCPNSDISTETDRTTGAGTCISSGDTKEKKTLYGVYVGIAVGLAAMLLIACIVTLIIIRKRRQQASHKKSAALEMELETAKKQEMATTANNRTDGKVKQSHHIACNINDYQYAEIPDVQFSQVSNTGDKKMCNLSSERQNISCDHGKVDDVYNTTYESSSHVHDDAIYDHIKNWNMYDTTNIVKKNAIVDSTYDYRDKQETYVETHTMMKNAMTDPTYDHAEKRFI